MSSELARSFLDSLPSDPRLTLISLAVGAAEAGGGLDDATLELMAKQVEAGLLADIDPRLVWPFLARGLMAERPSGMLAALSACGALERLIPELAVLAGCFQSAPRDDLVDIGLHQGRVVDEAARRRSGLPVRLAALLFNLGKADSPPQHLPTHYRHIDRCLPRIRAICERFGIADELREFAILVAMELERVHRATRMRAGSVAALLERVDAAGRRDRFQDLMTVCACDYCAYPGNEGGSYPKAELLDLALQAYLSVPVPEAAGEGEGDDEDPLAPLGEARALAVARALRPER